MKHIYSALLALFIFSTASAQHNLGIANSNWSCINSIYLNPANIAECREKKSVSVIAASFYVDNNVGPFNAGNGLIVAVGDGKTNNMFSYTGNSKISMMAPYLNITGPGSVHKLDQNSSLAFTSRLRCMNQFNFFDQTIFHAFNDPKYKPEDNIMSQPRNFAYTAHVWMEIGGTYARKVYEKNDKKIRLGGTFRYLLGIAYVGVKGESMNATFTKGNEVFQSTNTDIQYSSNTLNTISRQGNDITRSFGRLLSRGAFGHGIGGDVGAVYEFKSKTEKARKGYTTKIALSINDIGGIAYGKRVSTNQVINGEGNITARGILDNVKNFENMEKYVEKNGFTATTRKKSSFVYMPTHTILSVDYHLKKQYYVNSMMLINLASRRTYGNNYYNQVSIVPRYETKNLTIGLPITFNTLSARFKTGLGVSFYNFYIGSDDILAFALKSEYGINIYAGITKRFYK